MFATLIFANNMSGVQKVLMSLIFSFLVIVSYGQKDFVFEDARQPDSLCVSFILKDSLIQIHAFVNGRKENFILDNACPYLVLNAAYMKMKTDSSVHARGVGGEVKSGIVYIDSFYWQGIEKGKFNAVAAELNYLGDSICGLIGFDVFRNYKVTIDFDSSRIQFIKSDKDKPATSSSEKQMEYSFQMNKHLPIVEVRVNKDTLLMGIDCAASQNMLYSKYRTYAKDSTNLPYTILRGGGASPLLVQEGIVESIYLNSISYQQMKFVFDDIGMDQINQTLPVKIDGMFGLPFFKKYKTTIDFPNNKLIIYHQ